MSCSTVRKSEGETQTPNWLDLPDNIWLKIFSLLRTLDIIQYVEKVCMLFNELCRRPSLFKVIDMYTFKSYSYSAHLRHYNSLTSVAADRSAGGLVDVYLDPYCDDYTFMFIAERSKNLKHIRLRSCDDISNGTFVKAIQNLPKLEELHLIASSVPAYTLQVVGRSCPLLRSLSLSRPRSWCIASNQEALAISKSMPHLRHLQLLGSVMTNEGLEAILDGCPHLESLDLRGYFHLDLSGPLSKRCERIKNLQLLESFNKYMEQKEGTPYLEWSIFPEKRYDFRSDYDGWHGGYSDYDSGDYDGWHGGFSRYDSDYVSEVDFYDYHENPPDL